MFENISAGKIPICYICHVLHTNWTTLEHHILTSHVNSFVPLYGTEKPAEEYRPEPSYEVKQEPDYQNYLQSSYQVIAASPFIKCPLCPYEAVNSEMLQTHVNSDHSYHEKIYSDLKPSSNTDLKSLSFLEYKPANYSELNTVSYSELTPVDFTSAKSLFCNPETSSNTNQQPLHYQLYYNQHNQQELTPIEGTSNERFSHPFGNLVEYGSGRLTITPVQQEPHNLSKEKVEEAERPPLQQPDQVSSSSDEVNKKSRKRKRATIADETTERSLECGQCDKTFRRRDHLNKHVLSIHTSERRFSCHICSKRYTSMGTLRQHMNNSHSQKMLSCQFCDKTFARNDHMQKHIQGVHLKERKYICQHCNKGYTSHGAMLQHIGKSHLEKNFSCQKCSRKFATNVRLQIHIQETSLQQNKFVCEICTERFPTESALSEHSVKTHKIKSWQCDLCKHFYKGKYILQAHLKKMHGM